MSKEVGKTETCSFECWNGIYVGEIIPDYQSHAQRFHMSLWHSVSSVVLDP